MNPAAHFSQTLDSMDMLGRPANKWRNAGLMLEKRRLYRLYNVERLIVTRLRENKKLVPGGGLEPP